MNKHQAVDLEIYEMRKKCADSAIVLMKNRALAGLMSPLQLCYKPSQKGVSGVLLLVAQGVAPHGFILTNFLLKTNIPFANYLEWVRVNSMNLSILSF